ncbi:MAG: HlyD family efflux transporter periplasmic adaptor subunit [Bacteroidia bacterium]|nr:HlyD family efflux transporter periplasmic adaptor subunit [Bacteroidia bacterium]
MGEVNTGNTGSYEIEDLKTNFIEVEKREKLAQFIGNNPPWLIRNGMVFFLGLIVLLLGSTWFITYPDSVKTQSLIRATSPPKEVVIKNGGRIVKLLKREGETVKRNEVIAFIESTAKHQQVIRLYDLLVFLKAHCSANRLEDLVNYWDAHQSGFSELGELQAQHQNFVKSLLNFKSNLSQGSYFKRKSILIKDLSNTKRLYTTLKDQQLLQQLDLKLQEANAIVADTLHKKSVYTDLEWRQAQSQFINKKMALPVIQSSLIGNENQQNAIQKSLIELENQTYQERNLFIEELFNYINLIEEWKQKYILQAPASGKILYSGFVNENQFFSSTKPVCYITNETQVYLAEAYVPISFRSKVSIGQKVKLKFPAYSVFEFGTVNGIILEIKDIPLDSVYLAKIGLPDGLLTNTNKRIMFNNGLTAIAEITVRNSSLLQKLINSKY